MNRLRQGGFLIARIHQAAGRRFFKKLKECNLQEINPAQGRILFVLWEKDGIPIQVLARKTSLGKSTLTSMLDRLEESGHIRRVPSQEDRRTIIITLTEKDKKLRNAYNKVSNEMTALFYRGLSVKEVDVFERNLEHILDNLEKAETESV
jgi:DNA-binding MarR family transcriptional regulator